MKVKFALPELFGMHCQWFHIGTIFFLLLIAISPSAYAIEDPALCPTVMQAQQTAEETIDRVVQFRHLEGLREIFRYFSRRDSAVASNNARRKKAGAMRSRLAEEALARVIEKPNSHSESTPLEPAPPVETPSKPEASISAWTLWGFGAGARTGYDSYKMPEISWPGEEAVIVREDSFKPVAVNEQENFLSSQHIRRDAANSFMLGFEDGWLEGNAAASKDFPHLLPGQRYDCPTDTPAPGAARRFNSLKQLIRSRAKVLGVESKETSETINQIDCSWESFAYLFEKPVEKYSPADFEILKLSWSQIMSSVDVMFLIKKHSYVSPVRGQSLEYMQQTAFDDALAGRPWSAPAVMAHATNNELTQALLSNIFRVLADKLLIEFETNRNRNDKEQ
jgi:hypothetical protein